MSSINLFPIKIYKTKFAGVDNIKKNLFPKLEEVFNKTKRNNVRSMQDGTLCSFYESNNLQDDPICRDFVEFAEFHAREYWRELCYIETLIPHVTQIWANQTPNAGWIQSHLHGSIPLTATLYVNAAPGMGNLVIENPLDSILVSQPMDYKAQETLHHEVEVETGDFVMFPGWIRHHVKPNTTDQYRLILGVHFGSKGSYVAGQWA
jgi:uncharacterized protein (TIGR02466 family)